MKWNTLLYSLLFSGLGIFSFLLLANYTNLTPQVTNTIHTPGAFVFVVATFNILGYCTLRISSWMNRLYSNNLRWKWKCGLSTQRHTHLAVGGFRVLAPKPYLHVSMYTAFH